MKIVIFNCTSLIIYYSLNIEWHWFSGNIDDILSKEMISKIELKELTLTFGSSFRSDLDALEVSKIIHKYREWIKMLDSFTLLFNSKYK